MDTLTRRLDLTSLRLFIAVCQEKNIGRAAERECIAPSAVSRRIADIEAAIGLPVIHRESRGISVTPVGEMMYRHALAVIERIEYLSADVSRFASGAKGTIRIVGNMSSIVQFLPEDIAAFQRAFPDVEIEIEELITSDVLSSVQDLDVDLGICNLVPGVEKFEHLPYRTDRLVLMVPNGHSLARKGVVRLADFAGESLVGLRSEAALSQLLEREAQALGATLRVKVRVGSLDALCRMVHVGLGLAVVPQQIGELYTNTLNVKLLPINESWALRELVVIFRQRERLSAAAAALLDYLTQR